MVPPARGIRRAASCPRWTTSSPVSSRTVPPELPPRRADSAARGLPAGTPRAAEAVRRLVREGRLQVGPWYVLADELIPSGESLVRNLLAGAADAERLGAADRTCSTRPTPSVIPPCGPRWRASSESPRECSGADSAGSRGIDGDLFRWFGPDGRSVVLYHLPPAGIRGGRGPARRRAEARGGMAVASRRRSSPGPGRRTSRSSSAPITTRPIPTSAGSATCSPELEPGVDGRDLPARRVPRGGGRRIGRGAGAARRAPLVVRLHLDAARRARHPRGAQAPAHRGGALARARGGAAGRARRWPRTPASRRASSGAPGGLSSARSFTTRSPGAPPIPLRAACRGGSPTPS